MMVTGVLSIHEGLGASGRLPGLARQGGRVTALEWAMLGSLGLGAALLSAYGTRGLGVPGHNILRVIFPMAMGLALVPRHGSGTIMGLGGLAGGTLLTMLGPHGLGAGALTGLVLLGLALDLAMLGAASGRAVYLRFAAAGLAANLVALAARGGLMLSLHDPKFAAWLPRALVSYPVCGLLAGLVSAAVWFRIQARSRPRPGSEASA
jgi:hypothetical protein